MWGIFLLEVCLTVRRQGLPADRPKLVRAFEKIPCLVGMAFHYE
jgi:hypothetical protein